ncbi:unnamed protein product [Trichogramma brassicae]|uniref:PHD finger protein rhinoceros n=1 Tax=Trichogramma brassicae TaxID=86971 RepID=A0A6H5IX97_9HYME|nr:unnamed protein product [Trichogramma brassicae]
MAQRGKRSNKNDNDSAYSLGPIKRRKCRVDSSATDTQISAATLGPSEEEETMASSSQGGSSWTPRPQERISNIYNRSVAEAPAELYRKDLISAMKLPDSEPLNLNDYWIISDQWKQEWEKGVQVPVNPDSLPEPTVLRIQTPPSSRLYGEFKLPKKYLRICKDEGFNVEHHFLSTTPARAEKACGYDLDDTDIAWLEIFNGERAMSYCLKHSKSNVKDKPSSGGGGNGNEKGSSDSDEGEVRRRKQPTSKNKDKSTVKNKESIASALIVPQRQAAKKASENIQRSHNKKELTSSSAPSDSLMDSKPLIEKPLVKGSKDSKESKLSTISTSNKKSKSDGKQSSKDSKTININDTEKEVGDSADVISYVPQRKAAKKAAEHIKSGISSKSIVPITEIDTFDNKLKKESADNSSNTNRKKSETKKEDGAIKEEVSITQKKSLKKSPLKLSSESSSTSSSSSSSSSSSDSSDTDDSKSPEPPTKHESKTKEHSLSLSSSSDSDSSPTSSSHSKSNISSPRSRRNITKIIENKLLEENSSKSSPISSSSVTGRKLKKLPDKKLKTSDGRHGHEFQPPCIEKDEPNRRVTTALHKDDAKTTDEQLSSTVASKHKSTFELKEPSSKRSEVIQSQQQQHHTVQQQHESQIKANESLFSGSRDNDGSRNIFGVKLSKKPTQVDEQQSSKQHSPQQTPSHKNIKQETSNTTRSKTSDTRKRKPNSQAMQKEEKDSCSKDASQIKKVEKKLSTKSRDNQSSSFIVDQECVNTDKISAIVPLQKNASSSVESSSPRSRAKKTISQSSVVTLEEEMQQRRAERDSPRKSSRGLDKLLEKCEHLDKLTKSKNVTENITSTDKYKYEDSPAEANIADLRTMRERKKSIELSGSIGSERRDSLSRETFSSPAEAQATLRPPSLPGDDSNLCGESVVVPEPAMPALLPGLAEVRTYNATTNIEHSFASHLLGPYREPVVDEKSVLNKRQPETDFETGEPGKLLKVKIKGPFLDASYGAAVVASTPTQTLTQPLVPPTPIATSGTSSLRRMRKKELLRQYCSQDMNMNDPAGAGVPSIPPSLPPINRTVITIPKAVASMTSIPTREDYKAVVDQANMEKDLDKKRRRERAHLGNYAQDSSDEDTSTAIQNPAQQQPTVAGSERRRGSSASGNSGNERRRGRQPRPISQGPATTRTIATPVTGSGAHPKLKIKIGQFGAEPTTDDRSSSRPPKKRLSSIPSSNNSDEVMEELKRESLKFRRQIMMDFEGNDAPARTSKPKRDKKDKIGKRKKKASRDKEGRVELLADGTATPKLIIRLGNLLSFLMERSNFWEFSISTSINSITCQLR